MVMRAMREGASGGILKFFLFGLLIMAVGGLVMMDVGGFFRGGGLSRTDVVKVGSETIGIGPFDSNVRRTLSRIGIPPSEAYKLGYIEELANSEVRNSLMIQSARALGIEIGRDRLAQQIHKIVAPMVRDGESPQQVLENVLRNQGMSEGQFITSLRREASVGFLSNALQGSMSRPSETMLKAFYQYQNESRDITLAVFPDSDVRAGEEPAEEQLLKIYDVVKEAKYATPETRNISLVFIQDKNLEKTIDLSEEEVRAAYDENIDSYTTPETRTLEQAVLKTEDEAYKVYELVKNGKSIKDAAQEVTGESKSYLAPDNFEKEGLLEEIRDSSFKAKEGALLKPIETALGWHVIAVKKVNPPTVKSFASVRALLEKELKQLRLSDQLYSLANALDDALAGGATLEEAGKEVELEIKPLPEFNVYGQNKQGDDALSDYKDERTLILETAFDLEEGETSPVMELQNGRFMAIHVKSITPKTYKPFEDVKADLKKQWMKDQAQIENKMRAMGLITRLDGGDISLPDLAKEEGISLQKLSNVPRMGNAPNPLNERARDIVFETPVKGYALLTIDGGAAIAEVQSASLPDEKNISKNDLGKLTTEVTRGLQNEALAMYMLEKQQKYGTRVNLKLLETVYGPGQGQ